MLGGVAHHGPFATSREVDAMELRPCLLAALLFLPLSQAKAQDRIDFAGTWSGTWWNSTGQNGALTMRLSEDSAGRLNGNWDDVKVTGNRTNNTTLELRGTNPTRSYHYTATIHNGKMRIKYVATRLDADGFYDGGCTLTRD